MTLFWVFVGFIAFWGIFDFFLMIKNRRKEKRALEEIVHLREVNESILRKITPDQFRAGETKE
jgi:hypothetical protein